MKKKEMQKNSNESMERLKRNITAHWPLRRGKAEIVAHLDGKMLTRSQAILAQCYVCAGGYEEGPYDCNNQVCSLYPFNPYRSGGPRKMRSMSEEQRQAAGERLRRARVI